MCPSKIQDYGFFIFFSLLSKGVLLGPFMCRTTHPLKACTVRWFLLYSQGYTYMLTNNVFNTFIIHKRNPASLAITPKSPRPARPWHPLISYSLWICRLGQFVWVESCNTWSLGTAPFPERHVFTVQPCCSIFIAKSYSLVYMGPVLFTHSSVDGHVGCVHFLCSYE